MRENNKMAGEEDLTEFLILRNMLDTDLVEIQAAPTPSVFIWNHNKTLMFLDLYKTYRKQVGSHKIKNMKRMFEIIAEELSKKLNANVLPTHCENRWKVLERGYKKYIDNNTKTGHGRKNFEYADPMHEILGTKKNINPVILLSSETIDNPLLKDISGPSSSENCEGIQEIEHTTSCRKGSTEAQKPRGGRVYKKKNMKLDIFIQNQENRKLYYEKRYEQEERKIFELKRKNDIAEKKLNELHRQNDILEMKTNVLKEYVQKGDIIFANACD